MPPRSYYEVDRRQDADKNRAQHNDLLRTLVEHGVPGATLLALLVTLMIGRGVKLARQCGRGEGYYDGTLSIAMLAAACTVVVNGVTHNTLVESQIMSGFWLICGLLYSDRAMQKETLAMLAIGQGRDDSLARSR
jgi:O-antigen ligase